MKKAELGRRESARRRRAQMIRALCLAPYAILIELVHIGAAATLITVMVTPVVAIGLIWALLMWDRRRRLAHLPLGSLATAGASCRAVHLQAFDPTLQLRVGREALLVGDAQVGPDAFAWRPRKRFRRRGAQDIELRWADVEEMNCLRQRGLFRCDACSFSLSDGREFLIYITDPVRVEVAAASLGVHVTSTPVRADGEP